MSDFHNWNQKDHSQDWLLFPKNLSSHLSIDETNLSNDELYTIISNKKAKGKKGAIVAMIKGVKAFEILEILRKIPFSERLKVEEVTLDMSSSMDSIVREGFPNCRKVSDRFHVQQLVSEALQNMRIEEKWKAVEEENEEIKVCRKKKVKYLPYVYPNGDTKKQLLSRARYVLFKPKSRWTDSQKERAQILFKEFSKLKKGYELSMMFRSFYEFSETREKAKTRLNNWYKKVEDKKFKYFVTAMESIKNHEGTILNYFVERSTNASAESFNAKLKGFRELVRGVTDRKFFLFRVTKIYA